MTTIDHEAGAPEQEHAPRRAGPREWTGLAVLTLPVLLLALDMNVLHLAAPALSADLEAGSTQLLWILDVYGFMIAGFLVTMGTLGDRIGRRKLLLIGAAAFGSASVLAAYAPTAETLIAARALLGVAGATLMPSTLGLIRNLFPDARQRSMAIGMWTMAFVVGSAIGPIVGGLLLERFWWGSVFLLGVPVMVLLLVAGPVLLPEHRDENSGRLDVVSALLVLGAMLPAVYGVKEFAKEGVSPGPTAAVVIGLVFAVVFVRRQRGLADPMVDLTLFRNRGFGATLVLLVLCTVSLGGLLMMFVQFMQMVRDYSALSTGLWMLPGVAASIAASVSAPMLARKVRPVVVIAVGLTVAIVGMTLFTQVPAQGGMPLVATGLVLVFLGISPLMVLGTDLVVGSAPKERSSSAASLSETTSELGAALSIAMIGSVVTAVYTSRMDQTAAGAPGPARDNLAAALEIAGALPSAAGEALVSAGRAAFTEALHLGAVVSACVMAVALVVSLLTLRRVPPIGSDDH